MSKRVDGTQKEIVEGLGKLGMDVYSTAMVSNGFPDICVFWRGDSWVLELKNGNLPPSKRKLTPDERKFWLGFKGRGGIVHSLDEAVKLILAGRQLKQNKF